MNRLFPFPEISMRFCCNNRVSILDWPHRFPRCEMAPIRQSPGKHYSAHPSSLCFLRREWGGGGGREEMNHEQREFLEGRKNQTFNVSRDSDTLLCFSHGWQPLVFCFWAMPGQLGHAAGKCSHSSGYQMPSNSCYHYLTGLRKRAPSYS